MALPALFLHGCKRLQLVAVIAAQAARVVVDDRFHFRQAPDHLQDLVDLLLVLGHDHLRIAMVDDVGDLVEVRVLVEADGGGADRLRR